MAICDAACGKTWIFRSRWDDIPSFTPNIRYSWRKSASMLTENVNTSCVLEILPVRYSLEFFAYACKFES